jgi:hypothetical protein
MKAALKHGLSQELLAILVYQAEEPHNFAKFVDLCIKLDYQIHAHTVAMKCQTTPAPPCCSPVMPYSSAHLISKNSGDYGAAPMDLSASQKA